MLTDLQRILAQLSAREEVHLDLESYPSAMVMADLSGTILLVNSETEKLFQYRREELVGQSIDILIPTRHLAKLLDYRKALSNDLHAQLIESGADLFGLRKDGTEIPVEVGFNPIRLQDGSIVIVGAIVDASAHQRNNQMKDEFVAMVSHELRTPLTSIAASLGLLVANPDETQSEAAKHLIRIALSNSLRLVRLINNILDVEKLESGKAEFDMKKLNIRPIVEQAIECNRGFAKQFDVTIQLDAASADSVVYADMDRLIQVFTNLLSNAVKNSPPTSEVWVTVQEIGTRVRIAIRDDGRGISEEFKAHIFERFAQADSTDTRQKGGSGLGLNIVKQIVLKLGGEVGFDPAQGGGTVFYVDLPRCGAETLESNDHARKIS